MAKPINCPWCRSRHMPGFLCGAAKAVLDEQIRRADALTLPSIELDSPIRDPNIGQSGDQLVVQVVVKAAHVELGGTYHPALVFTGRTADGPLPHWMYAGSDKGLRDLSRLVSEMAELAIRATDAVNDR